MSVTLDLAQSALDAAGLFVEAARTRAAQAVAPSGAGAAGAADREQRRLHGCAWIATTHAARAAATDWARRAQVRGGLREVDELVLKIGFGEYLNQLLGGVPMSQNEFVRPGELGVAHAAAALAGAPSVQHFLAHGATAETRSALVGRLGHDVRPSEALDDETLDMVREQFRTFTAQRIAPKAHAWHLADALIPDPVLAEMAELGVFGVCIEEAYGGLGLGKLAMCVVSEELSRGWICAGSLGTRSEIAGN